MEPVIKYKKNMKRIMCCNYDEKIVCFLDILGFSDKSIKSEKPLDMQIVAVLKFDEDVAKKLSHVQICQFADSIVLAADAENVNALFEVVANIINQMTYECAQIATTYGIHQKNFQNDIKSQPSLNLIRGGMTFGEVLMLDEKIVTDEDGSHDVLPAITLGSAVSVAHYIESKIAKYPRIVIDDAAYQQLRASESVYKYIATDMDNERYFDFLLFLKDVYEKEWDDINSKFSNVANFIEANLPEFSQKGKDDIKVKYGWMYQYICRSLK